MAGPRQCFVVPEGPLNDIAALALLLFEANRQTITAALAGACALPVVRFGDDRLDPRGRRWVRITFGEDARHPAPPGRVRAARIRDRL